MDWLFGATAIVYAGAGAAALAYLVGAGSGAARAARWLMAAAFLVHTVEIGARGVAGLHPASSGREALGFAAWLMVGGYLWFALRGRLAAVAAFVAPATLLLLTAARLMPASPSERSSLTALGRVHISLATVGVSIFGLATVIALAYLFQERQLKQRRVGSLVRRGTALDTLDRLAHRCVQIGFPIFTVAIVTGAVWSAKLDQSVHGHYILAVAAWTAFAGLLLARTTAGWRGRRAALVTIGGFAATLVVLAIYLARDAAGA